MYRRLAMIALALVFAAPAFALDMPTRKAGLWEIKMVFEGRNLPVTGMRQCVDQATDKLMNANFGGPANEACSKQDMKNSGGTIVVDSVCKFGDATTTSHAVVTGSFDSAYAMQVTSTRAGGRRRDPYDDRSEMARRLRGRAKARRRHDVERHEDERARSAKNGRRAAEAAIIRITLAGCCGA